MVVESQENSVSGSWQLFFSLHSSVSENFTHASSSYTHSQLQTHTQAASPSERRAEWDHYPSAFRPVDSQKGRKRKNIRPRYGILMGGTSDYFRQVFQSGDMDGRGHDLSSVMVSTCIAKLYAMNMGYAFKLVTNLENVSTRKYGPCPAHKMSAWHKIQLVRTFLPDVDNLLWLDLDALIVRPTIPLSHILDSRHRETTELGAWMCAHTGPDAYHRNITGSAATPFFFASKDINPKYAINLNTGVFAVKNTPLAFDFLTRVWRVGDNVDAFKKHDPWWRFKTPCTDYWGWPWEQGGIWDVLADSSHLEFLKGTVFLPSEGVHGLNSVTDGGLIPGDDFTFVLHGKGSNEMLNFRYITRTLLDVLEVSPTTLSRECPVLVQHQDLLVNVSCHYSTILRKMMMT